MQISQDKTLRGKANQIGFLLLRWFCVFGVLLLLLIARYFWSSAGYAKDRYGVLSAMLRLTLTDEKVVAVGGRSDVVLMKSSGYQKVFDGYMKNLGWSFADRMGASVYFCKDAQELTVVDGSMTRYFRIHGLGCNPYDPTKKRQPSGIRCRTPQ